MEACFKQGNPARNGKKQFLKTFFSDSTYRGYRGHFPDIAIATAKFPISRYRDDRDLSVCLLSDLFLTSFLRCLLSAANHSLEHLFSMETIEKAIIEEFGQCLNKIIDKGTVKEEVKEEN